MDGDLFIGVTGQRLPTKVQGKIYLFIVFNAVIWGKNNNVLTFYFLLYIYIYIEKGYFINKRAYHVCKRRENFQAKVSQQESISTQVTENRIITREDVGVCGLLTHPRIHYYSFCFIILYFFKLTTHCLIFNNNILYWVNCIRFLYQSYILRFHNN